MSQKTSSLVYQCTLLKLRSEALCPNKGYDIDAETIHLIASEVQKVHAPGIETAVVIGGKNIWRGADAAATSIDRTTADYMGMLAMVRLPKWMESMMIPCVIQMYRSSRNGKKRGTLVHNMNDVEVQFIAPM